MATRAPKPVTEPIDASDDLRLEGESRGRPRSQLTQDLLDGKTKIVPFGTNPENFRRTLRSHGYRLRSYEGEQGIVMWAEEIEPEPKKRGRK